MQEVRDRTVTTLQYKDWCLQIKEKNFTETGISSINQIFTTETQIVLMW